MKLTEEQEAKVREWAAERLSLSDIQKNMEREFELRMSYMEARFLIADLGVSIHDPNAKPEVEEEEAKPADASGEDAEAVAEVEELPVEVEEGGVSVTMDQINRPDTMVSGKVTFSDGENAEWYVDTMGQLGLNPTTEGYRPSEEDLRTFQTELQAAISGGDGL